jgi:hypothetical protein
MLSQALFELRKFVKGYMPRASQDTEKLWLISSRRHYCNEQAIALAMACLLVDSSWLTVAISYKELAHGRRFSYINDLVKVSMKVNDNSIRIAFRSFISIPEHAYILTTVLPRL